jgi:hypothetical protein
LANDLIEHSRSSISPAPAGLFCFCHIHASRHWALLPPLAFTSARRIIVTTRRSLSIFTACDFATPETLIALRKVLAGHGQNELAHVE